MSAAPALRFSDASPVVETLKAYNELVEHRYLFTPAEFTLGMCVVHRGGHRAIKSGKATDGVISDKTWENWTGLDPRSKELATRGLVKKGFRIEGRGSRSRFIFSDKDWAEYVEQAHEARRAETLERPRTEGRRVDPKPQQKIHPECRESGCALLRRDSISLVPATQDAKPVSHSAGSDDGKRDSASKQIIPLPAIKNAKRVSQTAGDLAQLWGATLAALREYFPLVGLAFLARLLAAIAGMFAGLTDSELAQAVHFAWKNKSGRQQSEGLFILTIPEAIQALRRRPNKAAAGERGAPGDLQALTRARERFDGVACGGRAAALLRHLPALDSLIKQWQGEIVGAADLYRLEREAAALESAIFATAWDEVLFDTDRVDILEMARSSASTTDQRRESLLADPGAYDRELLLLTFERCGLLRLVTE